MNMNLISGWAGKIGMLLTAFTIVFSACDNKEPVPEEGGQGETVVDNTADSLVNVIYRQASAMSILLTDASVGVSSCKLQENGSYQVTLSAGSSFVTLGTDEEYSPMLTYAESDSELCWAFLDKKAVSQTLKKPSGNVCLLTDELEIKIADDKYYLVIGGQEYATEFTKNDPVQAFVCRLHADAAGEVYAVTFEFAGHDAVTYYVTSYTGVTFRVDSQEVKEMFVANSKTVSLVLDAPKGVDYKLAVSEGWSFAKREEADVVYVDVTAPEQTGATGELKVLTTVGDVVMSQVVLTTEPFRSVFASATDVVVVPNNGVAKFVYGVSELSAFSTDSALQNASSLLSGGSVQGCGVAEASISKPIVEVLGGEMDPEARYVLWAVPASANSGSYAVEASNIRTAEFGAISFSINPVSVKLLDAELMVTVKGADAVFGGVIEKTDDAMSEIVYQIENSIQDSIPAAGQIFKFEGLMSDYPAVDGYKNEIEPGKTYIVWAAAAVSGEYTYSEKDVYSVEVTTNSVVAGGSIVSTIGQPEMSPSTFKASVTADNAAMIYYAFLDKSTGDRYSTAGNADKYTQMMKKSPVAVKGSSVTVEGKKLEPNTTYWLYVVAVDEDGKYGQVSCVSGKTLKLEYDTTIKLTVEKVDVTAKKATFKVTSAGGDLSDYIYWAGSTMDPFWLQSAYCGGDKDLAQKYMALNPNDENITRAMSKYGSLAADGTITIDGLTMETDYVFVILEKGASLYSKVGYLKVTTLAADLGEIVVEGSDKWLAAKETVKLDWIQNAFQAAINSNMMASYAFNFSCPKNMTAYVMCASENYFKDAGFTKIEHIMIEIENYASRRYANGKTPLINGEHANEPDYYKDGELKKGQLMNVYEFCVHGVPALGFVTYFAEGSHGEGNCIYWENGVCTQYQSDLASIARFNSLEPWEERAQQFGLTGKEASDWALALQNAYAVYYKDAKPVLYENHGEPLRMSTPYATGMTDEGVIPDRVVVMLKDLQGNYYHPMYFEVPNYFN